MSHDCNECAFYSAFHGVCQRKGHNFERRYGYEKACKDFKIDPIADDAFGNDED